VFESAEQTPQSAGFTPIQGNRPRNTERLLRLGARIGTSTCLERWRGAAASWTAAVLCRFLVCTGWESTRGTGAVQNLAAVRTSFA